MIDAELPAADLAPFTEDEWEAMREYAHGKRKFLPAFIEKDPRKHFARWCALWDKEVAEVAIVQKSADDWQRMEEDAHTRADKAESALAAVTVERDAAVAAQIELTQQLNEVKRITTETIQSTLDVYHDRATAAEQALAGVRGRMTREAVAKALCRGSEQNGGQCWEGLDKFNRGLFYDQADTILALVEGKP